MLMKTISTPTSTDSVESIRDELDAIQIRPAAVNALLAKLNACLLTGQWGTEPMRLAIFGDSGVGKSKPKHPLKPEIDTTAFDKAPKLPGEI